MTKSETLRAAKALIEKPENWAKGYFAYRPTDGSGRADFIRDGNAMVKTRTNDAAATCFCVVGAVLRAADFQGYSFGEDIEASAFLALAYRELSKAGSMQSISLSDVSTFNDSPVRKHEDIMNLMDIAIRLAEADEAAAEHIIH